MFRALARMCVLAVAVSFNGCATPVLNPIATRESRISDPGMVGDWTTDEPNVIRVSVRERADGTLESALTIHQDNELKSALTLDVALTRIEGATYADLFLSKSDRERLSGTYGFLVLPVHQVAKVQRDEDTMWVRFLDGSWMDRVSQDSGLQTAKFKIAGAETTVITGPTASVRDFLREQGNKPEAFSSPFVFHRLRR